MAPPELCTCYRALRAVTKQTFFMNARMYKYIHFKCVAAVLSTLKENSKTARPRLKRPLGKDGPCVAAQIMIFIAIYEWHWTANCFFYFRVDYEWCASLGYYVAARNSESSRNCGFILHHSGRHWLRYKCTNCLTQCGTIHLLNCSIYQKS